MDQTKPADDAVNAVVGAALAALISQTTERVVGLLLTDTGIGDNLTALIVDRLDHSSHQTRQLGQALLREGVRVQLDNLDEDEKNVVTKQICGSAHFRKAVLDTLFDNGATLGRWARECEHFRWANEGRRSEGFSAEQENQIVDLVTQHDDFDEAVRAAIDERLAGLRLTVKITDVE